MRRFLEHTTHLHFIGRRRPVRLGAIELLSTLAFLLLTGSFSAEAQKPGKVYRIGYLGARSADPVADAALRDGLRELGYVEGKNVLFESRYAGLVERPLEDLATQLAAQLVRLHVDVIVTSPAPSVIRAALQASRTIPIVMPYTVVDPVAAGFVQSLARPGGNVTGLTNLESELYAKQLELLKETSPGISRVFVLWRQVPPNNEMQEVVTAGQTLGIEIQPLVLKAPRLKSLKKALSTIHGGGVDALLVARSAFMKRHLARIIDFADRKQLPTMYSQGDFADAGGLMSYEADRVDLYRRAAGFVARILRGANPADLAVEHPTKFELFINLDTARKLGLAIPQPMLHRADKIIHTKTLIHRETRS